MKDFHFYSNLIIKQIRLEIDLDAIAQVLSAYACPVSPWGVEMACRRCRAESGWVYIKLSASVKTEVSSWLCLQLLVSRQRHVINIRINEVCFIVKKSTDNIRFCQPLPNWNHLNGIAVRFYDFTFVVCNQE